MAASEKDVTTAVSLNTSRAGFGNENSTSPAVNRNGRYIAFSSRAEDLTDDDVDGRSQIDLFDRKKGTTELIAKAPDGLSGSNGSAEWPAISANGKHIAFASFATDLVPNGDDANGFTHVYVYDIRKGTITVVSANAAGSLVTDDDSDLPSMSANGRYVAFLSDATGLVPNDQNGRSDLFSRDVKKGTTTLIPVNAGAPGTANDTSEGASLSGSGRIVSFRSDATDLINAPANDGANAFTRRVR